MRGLKARGVKGTPARFANALQTVMNDLGVEGWEYQRTDTLPVEERQGLTGKTTTFQNMLVFRRTLDAAAEEAPVIAALIEDQTVAPSEPEPLYLVEEASVETTIEDPVVAEDFIGDIADDYVDDAAKTLAAQDRVSETLKAPFSFPWNKRTVAATPKDADKRDTNIPAK
ncbi:MAG: DUF4177 domain-containing protein [Octadecabacter sp.]